MMKLLVLLTVVGLALWLFFGRSRKTGRDDQQSAARPAQTKTKTGAEKPAQAMLVCAHCGVHLPASEAVTDAKSGVYCSDAHRLAGPRRS